MGFFYSDTGTTSKAKRPRTINSAKELKCKICPRDKLPILSPKIEPMGTYSPDVYIVVSQPSKDDDIKGEFLSDIYGDFIFKEIPDNVLDKVRINAVLRCYSPKSTDELELDCCSSFLREDIVKTKPKLILAFGELALSYFFNTSNVYAWRNRFIPIEVDGHPTWFFSTFSPKSVFDKRKVNKKTGNKEYETEYDHALKLDIRRAFREYRNLPQPELKYIDYNGIEYTLGNGSDRELHKVLRWLEEAKKWGPHALDIETNGLRPYIEDPHILSIAIGTFDKTYAFPVQHPWIECWTKDQSKLLMLAIKDYLLNSDAKICHNTKFELEWLSHSKFFGNEILRGTEWHDTMAQAYTMDERRGMLSLDTLCRINFGINLKAASNLDRANLAYEDLEKVLKYNALDTKWTELLFRTQAKRLNTEKGLKKVYRHLMNSTPTLAKAQQLGIYVDFDLREQLEKEALEQLNEISEKINVLPEIAKYKTRWGAFNPDSHQHIAKVLKDIMGLDEELKNKAGKSSTDESVLRKLDKEKVPIADLILKHRAINKKYTTYVKSLIDNTFVSDGKLHTNFNLYETTTGRLSSDSPNMQNWPNRRGREIRRLIIPPKDHWIVSGDYGQIEARLIGLASQDNVFCDALWNNYDVHMEWAEKIARKWPDKVGGAEYLNDVEKLKKFRKDVKNQWVFPAFYGASAKSIARAMNIPIDIVNDLFKEFWSTFKGVKLWQKRVTDFYTKNGYVETLTGRRRYGPMTYNMSINSPIQGAASDICVNAMNHLSEAGINVIMNIHDDVTSYVRDDELEQTLDQIAEIMCTSAYELIPILNIPIAIELSAGHNWCDQEEIGTYLSTEYMTVSKRLHNPEEFMNL